MNSSLDFSKIVSYLKPLRGYAAYLAMISIVAVFAYTGWTINSAFKPQIADGGLVGTGIVKFDQAILDKVKSLDQVNVNTGGDSLGDSTVNPFGN